MRTGIGFLSRRISKILNGLIKQFDWDGMCEYNGVASKVSYVTVEK
jgi:hypothetical protein